MISASLLLLSALQLAAIFPPGATVIEVCYIPARVHPNRILVLWMLNPVRSDCPSPRDWGPSCPDMTRGCHYSGPTRVSLVDSTSHSIINTLIIYEPWDNDDTFDVPFKFLTPGPYHHKVLSRATRVLWLHDYNDDGKALEFALYDALTCSDMLTTLIGYSERQDKIIQYPINVTYEGQGAGSQPPVMYWAESLFLKKPIRRGFWRYTLAFPGGPQEDWEVRYSSEDEAFYAHCKYSPPE
jgi:hypothetical protein